MSAISELLGAYRRHLELPWDGSFSAAERVWMLVYPPHQERRIVANLGELEISTRDSGRGWQQVDLSTSFGTWLAHHDYAEAFVTDPSDLTSALLEDYEDHVVALLTHALQKVDAGSVLAVVGSGALYPFARLSRVIEAIEPHLRGYLLVLFPGVVDQTTHAYRLLDARDGFSYRAVAITA